MIKNLLIAISSLNILLVEILLEENSKEDIEIFHEIGSTFEGDE